ncbi:MAG: hypothetical protein JXR58_12150 [Bacteroidales bacterium]|nr:hypothetical protein [Bacteroidales bacterium]
MDELKNIAPKLSELSKEKIFEVPENYFDSFPTIIQEKIELKEQKRFSFSGIIQFLKPQLVLVAGMSLIAVATYILLKMSVSEEPGTTKTTIIAQNSEQSSSEETDYYLNNIDEYIIIEAITNEPTSEDEIAEEELINYLADNLDTYTIIENY